MASTRTSPTSALLGRRSTAAAILATALLMVVSLSAAAQARAILTSPFRMFSFPTGVAGVPAVGDVNHDGRPDLVIPVGPVSVLLNQGNENFASPLNYSAHQTSLRVSILDINGDQNLDVVSYGGSISTLLGHGDGTLQLDRQYFATGSAAELRTGDLNHDGRPELVTPGYSSNSISVFRNAGFGGFFSEQVYAVSTGPRGLELGDVDGDGQLDALTTSYADGVVTILRGLGNATFGARYDIPIGSHPGAISLSDINRDGHLDLVAISKDRNEVQIRLGDGQFSFPALTVLPTPSPPSDVVLTDVNGDGADDLVILFFSRSMASVMMGLNGTFGVPFEFSTAWNPGEVVPADLDGDNCRDLLISATDGVCFLRGTGAGRFSGAERYATGVDPRDLTTAYLDSDGHLDLVVACASGNLACLAGRGDGTFGPPVLYPMSPGCLALTFADFDEDGHADFVTADISGGPASSGALSLRRGQANGSLAPRVALPSGVNPSAVASGDVNGDLHADLLMANQGDGTIGLLPGNGLGGFAPMQTVLSYPSTLNALRLLDATGDGNLDLLLVFYWGTVEIRAGNGLGQFGAPESFSSGGFLASNVELADLTNDGQPDLITTCPSTWSSQPAQVQVRPGLGAGNYGAVMSVEVPSQPNQVRALDLDGDNRLDLLVSCNQGSSVTALLGDGTGHWIARDDLGALFPAGLAIGDFDETNGPDAAVGNASLDGVTVLLNRGAVSGVAESFKPAPSLLVAPNPARGRTRIFLSDPLQSMAGVSIFDSSGRLVTSIRPFGTAGFGTLTWTGKALNGTPVPAGVYYIRSEPPPGSPPSGPARRLVWLGR